MALLGTLQNNREALLEKWLTAIFQTYPLETVGFMRRQTDQFENPIRHRTQEAAGKVVDALLQKKLDTDEVTPWLDELVRLRSVQEFTPARAVGIIFLLKGVIRKMLDAELKSVKQARELLQLESKIDSLALISFDIYTKCRQQLFELRVKEVKNSQASLLRRANMILDTSAEEPNPTKP